MTVQRDVQTVQKVVQTVQEKSMRKKAQQTGPYWVKE